MVECEKTDRHKKKKFESSLLKSRPAIIRANKKQVQMCSRVVSRLGLKRDFTQEPSFFFFILSLTPSPSPFFLGLASTKNTLLCLCITRKYAGVRVHRQTNTSSEYTFSLGTGLNIFNLMCFFTTACRVHGLFETFV